jgi:hypothetical protein
MSSAVIELRQYTLHPGRRDELITLFEREFVETQEAEGIDLIGQFVDLDDQTDSSGSGSVPRPSPGSAPDRLTAAMLRRTQNVSALRF